MQNFQQQYLSSRKVITDYCCRADKNPYRHDGRADKDPYRHDRRADSHCPDHFAPSCYSVQFLIVLAPILRTFFSPIF